VLGVVVYLAGWWLGWIELTAVGVGCFLALLMAMPFVFGGHALEVGRVVEPRQVERGTAAFSQLSVTNTGRAPSASRELEDRIDGKVQLVSVPALAPGASSQHIAELPTARRGVIEVGPAVVAKADPLGLFRRELGRTAVETLLVRPRILPLSPLRSGFAKDLEGPTHDTSPAGNVAFHAIREYTLGDDHRHIHWLSSARTGSLMVRHYVDNRRPHLGVLVDVDARVYGSGLFDEAIDIAGSQVVSAASDGRPVALQVGEDTLCGRHAPVFADEVLNSLCYVDSTPSPEVEAVEVGSGGIRGDGQLLAQEQTLSALLVITGDRSPEDLMPSVSRAKRKGMTVIVCRVVPAGTESVQVPRAQVLDCSGLDDFVDAWRGIVR